MDTGMRIGQLASELGLNPKTIRYYEDLGLMPEAARSGNGYRRYGLADQERLGFITKAKAIGLTLEEIGEVLAIRSAGNKPCEHVLMLLDRKLAAVDAQLKALQEVRGELITLREESVHTMAEAATVCGIIEHHQFAIPSAAARQGLTAIR